ncbi:hypothetical protein [Bacillus thuringiensis]|uniref:Uncharacterized protein n=1 Tax=Bacillus thuringiensis serovar andalousiensis TaxID=257985 RepID=A0A6H0TL38_BACTU|nr:hypothetical protein [Bacillus thuringiensis]QIW21187.1 hypothetical protein EVG22_23355 [Bacillus thuringiensis serovar andalousiensis]HDR7595236.1 hypothetical protein [Bacillus mycoides]
MTRKKTEPATTEEIKEEVEVETVEEQIEEENENKTRNIVCVGAAENSGSFCLVYRDDLTIYPGLLLEVGKEINEDEAADLLSLTTFKFKEVTK